MKIMVDKMISGPLTDNGPCFHGHGGYLSCSPGDEIVVVTKYGVYHGQLNMNASSCYGFKVDEDEIQSYDVIAIGK